MQGVTARNIRSQLSVKTSSYWPTDLSTKFSRHYSANVLFSVTAAVISRPILIVDISVLSLSLFEYFVHLQPV